MIGVKCPKCGLMQLAKDHCESCGAKLGNGPGQIFTRRSPSPLPETSFPTEEKEFQVSPFREYASQRLRLSFHGDGGNLFGIFLLNSLLTLLTAGFYYFWGKVKVRSYIWSKTIFEGDPFVYQGTGKELLSGFLKMLLLFGLPLVLLSLIPRFTGAGLVASTAASAASGVLVVLVRPLAIIGGFRYRLSRTSWRGIFFSFRGRPWEFVMLYLGGALLSLLTLGFYYPTFAARRREFMVVHSYFGSKHFEFDGRGRDLGKVWGKALFLLIPTLGLSWFWFKAAKERYFWEHTSFEGVRFRSTVTGRGLLNLNLGNALLLLITVGFGSPWITVRKFRYVISNLLLEGMLDPATIKQEAQDSSAVGEFLDGFLDTGFDLG